MASNWTNIVCAAAVAGCSPVTSSFGPVSSRALDRAAPAYIDLMPGGAVTASPAGWVDYCRRHGTDAGCGPAQ